MSVNTAAYKKILHEVHSRNAELIAVSKTKPVEDILELYQLGQRDFGENYVQELIDKQPQLPTDIKWHFIGHLQSNKVKYIASFIHMIHGVESLKLLREINKQAQKHDRVIKCLLQLHVAKEETKFGMNVEELMELLNGYFGEKDSLHHISIGGLMAMASFTNDHHQISTEFKEVRSIFDKVRTEMSSILPDFNQISMGMSSDYPLALSEGSTLVRVGSSIFGNR